MSNYTRGMTVLDISDPQDPRDVDFSIHFQSLTMVHSMVAWGVYPYLPSGNILISDISSGLYIVKDNTKLHHKVTSFDSSDSFSGGGLDASWQ